MKLIFFLLVINTLLDPTFGIVRWCLKIKDLNVCLVLSQSLKINSKEKNCTINTIFSQQSFMWYTCQPTETDTTKTLFSTGLFSASKGPKGYALGIIALQLVITTQISAAPKESKCPSSGIVLIEHEWDCTKFYVCIKGVKVVAECAPGLHFNVDTQTCDWPENPICELASEESEETEEVTEAPEESEETEEVTEAPEESEETEEVTEAPEESEETEEVTEAPEESEETEEETEAPEESEETEEITEPSVEETTTEESEEITEPSVEETTTEESVEITEPSVEETTTEESEEMTTEATEETVETTEPEPDTTTTPPTTEEPTEAPTTEKPSKPQPDCSTSQMYWPHPTDCGKFYQCSNGVPYEFSCPGGLHFNPSINVCDWPHNAGCQ